MDVQQFTVAQGHAGASVTNIGQARQLTQVRTSRSVHDKRAFRHRSAVIVKNLTDVSDCVKVATKRSSTGSAHSPRTRNSGSGGNISFHFVDKDAQTLSKVVRLHRQITEASINGALFFTGPTECHTTRLADGQRASTGREVVRFRDGHRRGDVERGRDRSDVIDNGLTNGGTFGAAIAGHRRNEADQFARNNVHTRIEIGNDSGKGVGIRRQMANHRGRPRQQNRLHLRHGLIL